MSIYKSNTIQNYTGLRKNQQTNLSKILSRPNKLLILSLYDTDVYEIRLVGAKKIIQKRK